ncbi:hypothetical protein [Salinisphaera sp. Q1T1-3]|uniref:hypothetical protein n=1 Tax=Salinisphaera sp. Q1T1-3 TaxID=2321229 RepID=UPI0018F5DBBB|nr:hypothetical protein [Salinisphaera sp. Q1T1-3]
MQLIVATRDPFVGRGFVRDVAPWVEKLRVDEIEAGHWAVMTHAPTVAARCREHFKANAGYAA